MNILKLLLVLGLSAHLVLAQQGSGIRRRLVVRKRKRPLGFGTKAASAEEALVDLQGIASDYDDSRDGRSLIGQTPFKFGGRHNSLHGGHQNVEVRTRTGHQSHSGHQNRRLNPFRARGNAVNIQRQRQAAISKRISSNAGFVSSVGRRTISHQSKNGASVQVSVPQVPGLAQHQAALRRHQEQITAHISGRAGHANHIVPIPSVGVAQKTSLFSSGFASGPGRSGILQRGSSRFGGSAFLGNANLAPPVATHVETTVIETPQAPTATLNFQRSQVSEPLAVIDHTVHHGVPGEAAATLAAVVDHSAHISHGRVAAPTPLAPAPVAPVPLPRVLSPAPAPIIRIPAPAPVAPAPAAIQFNQLDTFGVRQGVSDADVVDIGAVALAGERCIDKIVVVEETETDEQIECHHSYDKKCHTTYTTDFEPQQEEKCEENFKKNCFIEYKKVANNETVEFCHTPLVKDCNVPGPVECRTEYESECKTRYHKHVVEEDTPECTTIKEFKCETKVSGYKSEEDCTEWPVERCNIRTELVEKSTPETSCKKVPKERCAPAGCGFVQGVPECFDKQETVVQEVPEETCELEPQKECKQVTTLVPNLKPNEECVDVPKEVCTKSKNNPRKVTKPVVKKWCYTPTPESGLF